MLEPLLPKQVMGRLRADDRRVLNGIVVKCRSGMPWRDVPDRYGSWRSLHTRFRRWAADGTFTRMLQAAQARADATAGIDWLVSVDSTIVRAHRHAAGARLGGARRSAGHGSGRADQQDIHLACDGKGRPLALVVTGGNVNDCTRFTAVMATI